MRSEVEFVAKAMAANTLILHFADNTFKPESIVTLERPNGTLNFIAFNQGEWARRHHVLSGRIDNGKALVRFTSGAERRLWPMADDQSPEDRLSEFMAECLG